MTPKRITSSTLFLAMWTKVNLTWEMYFNMSFDTSFILVGLVTIVTSPRDNVKVKVGIGL